MISNLSEEDNIPAFKIILLGKSSAGKTKLLIGSWNNHFVHVPMESSAGRRKKVNPDSELWIAVLAATGQGPLKNNL